MDVVLHYADEWVLDKAWAWALPSIPARLARAGQAAKSAESLAAAARATPSAIQNLTHGVLNWTSRSSAGSGARDATARAAQQAGLAAQQAAAQGLEEFVNSSRWGRDHFLRQCISLYAITLVGIMLLYFSFAGLSYYFFFNHDMKKHPRFLKNQVRLEIESSLRAFLPLDILTLPWFVAEVRGHSMLYENISDYGIAYAIFSVPFFLVFTDACIYWVHRLEHHPRLYKHIHKPHHKWLVPTPFASHAFHPLDGYAQSLPYHIFVFLFPLHRYIYIGLFVFVNCWSILIHDSDMIVNSPLEKIINGPSHHTLHHLYFNVNYGQYFTGCDRLGGSYRQPKSEDDPLHDVVKSESKKAQ
ncbi:c5-sterol desaturase [Ceraceosorus bombacis]|uniref:C5-sterol desaturase n=1 Tax=Ceraceosorus bombacis TaxID=401625 RepID=A0A0P1BQP3_9BASI|nr:c5-sterol desaturase [Ceraceosorus bombacis]